MGYRQFRAFVIQESVVLKIGECCTARNSIPYNPAPKFTSKYSYDSGICFILATIAPHSVPFWTSYPLRSINGIRIHYVCVREAILNKAKAQPFRTETSAQLLFGMNKKY